MNDKRKKHLQHCKDVSALQQTVAEINTLRSKCNRRILLVHLLGFIPFLFFGATNNIVGFCVSTLLLYPMTYEAYRFGKTKEYKILVEKLCHINHPSVLPYLLDAYFTPMYENTSKLKIRISEVLLYIQEEDMLSDESTTRLFDILSSCYHGTYKVENEMLATSIVRAISVGSKKKARGLRYFCTFSSNEPMKKHIQTVIKQLSSSDTQVLLRSSVAPNDTLLRASTHEASDHEEASQLLRSSTSDDA